MNNLTLCKALTYVFGVVFCVVSLGNLLALGYYSSHSALPTNLRLQVPTSQEYDVNGVLDMYQGKPRFEFVYERFLEDSWFEDPLVLSTGPNELFRMFKSLVYLSPTLLDSGVIHSTEEGTNLFLHMKYMIGPVPTEVKSVVYLKYDAGYITSLTEQWEDIPLLSFCYGFRKLNGVAFALLAPYIFGETL